MNSDKVLSCNNFSRNNKLSRRLNKVLRSMFGLKAHLPLDKYLKSGGDEMTTVEVARLIDWAKKEGYTLEEIYQLIKYIAGQST